MGQSYHRRIIDCQKLERWREATGQTPEQFSGQLGISKSTYYKLIKPGGHVPITPKVYRQIAAAVRKASAEPEEAKRPPPGVVVPHATAIAELFGAAAQVRSQRLARGPVSDWPGPVRNEVISKVRNAVALGAESLASGEQQPWKESARVLVRCHELARLAYVSCWDRTQWPECRAISTTMRDAAVADGDLHGEAIWCHERAVYAEHHGDLVAAERELDRAWTILSALRRPLGRDQLLLKGHVLHRRGNLLLDKARFNEARQMFAQSLRVKRRIGLERHGDNELASTRSMGGMMTELRGLFPAAIRCQQRCLRHATDPEKIRPIKYRLARAMRKVGQFEAAADLCEGIAEGAQPLEFRRVECYTSVEAGISWLLAGKVDRARAALKRARAAWKPRKASGDRAQWRIKPGDGLLDLAALQSHLDWEARRFGPFEHIAELNSLMEDRWARLVFTCGIRHAGMLGLDSAQGRGMFEQAIRLLEDLVKRNEGHHDLYYWFALARLAAGHPDEAEAYYRRAVKTCPAEGVVLFALRELDLFFYKQPDDPGVKRCRRILEEAGKTAGSSAGTGRRP